MESDSVIIVLLFNVLSRPDRPAPADAYSSPIPIHSMPL